MSDPAKCPVCGKRLEGEAAKWPRFPFCSRRCKLIDLGKWLGEDYGLPREEPPDPDEYSEEPPERG
jgi:endogenous inhibitor of DNA gyrase (YacG/DUF329 family)